MDAATAAVMIDPRCNGLFHRHWTEGPHRPPVRVQAVDDIELTGPALLDEWRRVRSRNRIAPVEPGGERAGPPCPSGLRLDGLVTT